VFEISVDPPPACGIPVEREAKGGRRKAPAMGHVIVADLRATTAPLGLVRAAPWGKEGRRSFHAADARRPLHLSAGVMGCAAPRLPINPPRGANPAPRSAWSGLGFLLFSGGPCGGSTLRPVALARGGRAGAASACDWPRHRG
jgi:hypothetical protein